MYPRVGTKMIYERQTKKFDPKWLLCHRQNSARLYLKCLTMPNIGRWCSTLE